MTVSATTKREEVPISDWEKLPPYPRILLGDNIPWINVVDSGVCPGCHDQPLTSEMYCLRCDRWGRDDFGEVVITEHKPVPPMMLSSLRDKVNRIRANRCQKSAR
jgi:hypothetical protein